MRRTLSAVLRGRTSTGRSAGPPPDTVGDQASGRCDLAVQPREHRRIAATGTSLPASKLGIMFLRAVSSGAPFRKDKMGKSTMVQSDYFFVGLNAFEPGQEHAPHLHEGQDKLYLILEGS